MKVVEDEDGARGCVTPTWTRARTSRSRAAGTAAMSRSRATTDSATTRADTSLKEVVMQTVQLERHEIFHLLRPDQLRTISETAGGGLVQGRRNGLSAG